MNTLFSIIIPTYNREKTIERAIDSCLTQTYENFEVIIVDDCSTDNTIELVKNYSDERVRLIQNEVNSERCITRNNGIKVANGKYIIFLDSDDYFLPIHLETFKKEIESVKNFVALYFTNSIIEKETGEKIRKTVPKYDEVNKYAYLLKFTPNPARVCVHKDILDLKQFDPRIPGLEDLDLWLRIASEYPVYHIEEYTNIYYVHSESYTDGDEKRFVKELSYHPIIESQPELKGKLPKKAMNRLKSMCHFHLAQAAIEKQDRKKFYSHAMKSFRLFPKGYNGQTNKILFVNAIYFMPVLGNFAKWIKRK